MSEIIRRWTVRLTVTGFLITAMLIGIVLNPGLLYANKTKIDNYIVYHHSQLDEDLIDRITNAATLTEESELYDPDFTIEICLNDGSYYPTLIETLRGQAFGWGFYNKVVLQGKANYHENYVTLNKYRWNLEQLLAHESTHCYQFNKFGFWNANPIANYPNWKWEGYPEYVSRRGQDQLDTYSNIERWIEHQEENESKWAIEFSDSTVTPVDYYKDWILVQYCLSVKGMTYEDLLNDMAHKEVVEEEMLNWFSKKE